MISRPRIYRILILMSWNGSALHWELKLWNLAYVLAMLIQKRKVLSTIPWHSAGAFKWRNSSPNGICVFLAFLLIIFLKFLHILRFKWCEALFAVGAKKKKSKSKKYVWQIAVFLSIFLKISHVFEFWIKICSNKSICTVILLQISVLVTPYRHRHLRDIFGRETFFKFATSS